MDDEKYLEICRNPTLLSLEVMLFSIFVNLSYITGAVHDIDKCTLAPCMQPASQPGSRLVAQHITVSFLQGVCAQHTPHRAGQGASLARWRRLPLAR